MELTPAMLRCMHREPALKQLPRYDHNPDRPISNPKPKRDKAPAPSGAASGAGESVSRTRIRFTGYRVKPLDPDNFAGSVKDLLDGLRHAHLIEGDEPWRIVLETEQVKVAHYAEERTVIQLHTPDGPALAGIEIAKA